MYQIYQTLSDSSTSDISSSSFVVGSEKFASIGDFDAVNIPFLGSKNDASDGNFDPLGTIGKSVGRPPPLQTYISQGFEGRKCPSDDEIQAIYRLEKWALQAAARDILFVRGEDYKRSLSVCFCKRNLQRGSDGVFIRKHIDYNTFHYVGLQTCRSVWSCPICNGPISQERRFDLQMALQINVDRGGSAQLWTFTAPHNLGQSLSVLLDGLNGARKKMLDKRNYKLYFASLGAIGDIRSLEVTHSFFNGWHVHFHVLVLFSGIHVRNFLPVIKERLHQFWRSACLLSGLAEPSFEHGVFVDDGSRAARYVSKWGLEDEMTKSHSKKGREGHYSPFDFLRLYFAGDLRFAPLFKEYAYTFKGKRQLVWSRGLRDKLGMIEEKSDEQIIDEHDMRGVDFLPSGLPLSVWKVILKYKQQGQLLEVCRKGHDAFYDFIIELMESKNEL